MDYLRNAWYPLAWGEEVGQAGLFHRTLLNEPIVAYRRGDRSVVALADTCPHRFAPLHLGTLVDDCVQCPYHGLRFDGSGACVHNPHGDRRIPAAARVKSYPLVEQHTLLWIWMGDPAKAAASSIPDFSFLCQGERFTYTRPQVMRMPVSFDLILDNLMDLTHAAYLHPNNLGSPAVARGRMNVTQSGNTVHSQNLYPDGLPAPVFVATGACPPDQNVDYWVDVRWDAPASMHFDAGVTPAGRSREEGARLCSAQLLAPETESSTHYFWCQYRDFSHTAPGLTEAIEQAVAQAFATEDEPMISAVQQRMAGRDLWSLNPVLLATDSGAVRVRRLLAQMVQAERSAQTAAA